MIKYNILYQNVNGLTESKFSEILNNLNVYPLICISETWFIQHTHRIAHHNFIASTEITTKRQTGHQNGGMYLLADSSLKLSISIIKITMYTISILLDGINITFAYFPPSLNVEVINECLSETKIDLLIGDLNFRLGEPNNDSQRTIPERIQLFSALSAKWGLRFNRNQNAKECSRTDYVYSKSNLNAQWTYDHNFAVKSDHLAMKIELECESKPSNVKELIILKYNIKLLNNEKIRQMILSEYAAKYNDIIMAHLNETSDYWKITGTRALTNKKRLEWEIDALYSVFMDSIHDIMSNTLGSYVTSNKLQEADFEIDGSSTLDTIRKFKRMMRSSQRESKIVSNGGCVYSEATTKFQSTFNSENVYKESNFLPSDLATDLFTLESLKLNLKNYSNAKTGGIDGIHTSIIKVLVQSPEFISTLCKMFNLFYSCGCTPTEWNKTMTFLLPKKKGNVTIGQTRPISLTPIFRRIFERELIRSWDGTDWIKTSQNQTGFKDGYSTITAALLSHELSESQTYKLNCFLDIKGAFDKVDFGQLLQDLEERNTPKRDIALIESLLTKDAYTYVIVNGICVDEPIAKKCGVMQGSIISPILFNIYIDKLAKKLNELPNCISILFCDDVLLKTNGDTIMQVMLDMCSEWARSHKMKFGMDKSKLIAQHSKSPAIQTTLDHLWNRANITAEKERSSRDTKFYLDGNELERVDEYKYLGFPHRVDGIDFVCHSLSRIEKAQNLLTAVSDNTEHWDVKTKLAVWKSFIRSLSEYGLGIAAILENGLKKSEVLKTKYDKFVSNSVKWIFGKEKIEKMHYSILGIGMPAARLDALCYSVSHQIHECLPENPFMDIINSKYRLKQNSISRNIWNFQPYLDLTSLPDFSKKSMFKFLKDKRMDMFKNEKLELHKFIRGCRHDVSLADKLIYQTKQIVKLGIKWRTNKAFCNRYCTCGSTWNRKHLMTCSLLPDLDSETSKAIELHKEIVPPELVNSTYSTLDILLNLKKYDVFLEVMAHLDRILIA